MAPQGICLELTHTGLSGKSSLFLSDISDGADALGSFRKAGPIYVPHGGKIVVAYSGAVAVAFEVGSIRKYLEKGYLTVRFVFGAAFTSGLPPAAGVFSVAEKAALEFELTFKTSSSGEYTKVLSYSGTTLAQVRIYSDASLTTELYRKQLTYNVDGVLTSLLLTRIADGVSLLKTMTYTAGLLTRIDQDVV